MLGNPLFEGAVSGRRSALMSTIPIRGLELSSFSHGGRVRFHQRSRRHCSSITMTLDSKSSERKKLEGTSIQLPVSLISRQESSLTEELDLRFDRLQLSEQEIVQEKSFAFGSFVAREAMLDEEFWTAAWLRAESQWEDRLNDRYADNYKRKFADQEFNAIKKRTKCPYRQKNTCVVTVKKEAKNVKRTVLKSVVGTLDLSIRYPLQGETFPGERVKAPLFVNITIASQNRYGYVANLCVAKSARRQGIASNMLHFAVESAVSDGVGEVYVHVHRHNEAAQELYRKMGFEVVDLIGSGNCKRSIGRRTNALALSEDVKKSHSALGLYKEREDWR